MIVYEFSHKSEFRDWLARKKLFKKVKGIENQIAVYKWLGLLYETTKHAAWYNSKGTQLLTVVGIPLFNFYEIVKSK